MEPMVLLSRSERLAYARDYFHKTPVIGSWAGWLIRSARAGRTSKKHGAPTITEATLLALWEEQGGRCFWSGIEMSHARNHPWKVSLDRLDNGKGYEPGNVCLATWFMNRARGSMSVEEFRTSLLTVATNVYEAFDEPTE